MIKIVNTKKRRFDDLDKFDLYKLKIFVPATEELKKKLCLNNVGDVVVPSPILGRVARRNAIGYIEKDKTKPKKYTCVATIMLHPYGRIDIPSFPVDIWRDCYQKVFHEPLEIEMTLAENKEGKSFISAILNNDYQKNIVHIINLFIEVAGSCYISDDNDFIDTKYVFYNWKFLPEGILPHEHLKHILSRKPNREKTYEEYRLEVLDKYNVEQRGFGINGYQGYYAYVFTKICVFESSYYGNATYIVKKDNWEELSKKTKQELFNEKLVLNKIVHNAKWEQKIKAYIKKQENQ